MVKAAAQTGVRAYSSPADTAHNASAVTRHHTTGSHSGTAQAEHCIIPVTA